jgi:SAM-dependent methyltransferase
VNGTVQIERCAWCGRSLQAGGPRAVGRRLCSCGAATTSPWPSDAELEAAYGRHYRPPEGRFLGPGDRFIRHTRGRLAKRLDEVAPPGPVLDVGAGDGALLDALHREGRDATGLERRSNRPDVLDVEIEQAGNEWAALVMWHSLEHLRAPAVALTHAARQLRVGGILVLALPNAASLQARIFGDRWFALDLPRHLSHLPARLVLARLETLGLTIERVSYWRGGQVFFGWLHGLVGLLPRHPDLYDAIRRPDARANELARRRLLGLWIAALGLAPLALAGAATEVALRRGGTVYVEARRAG